MTKIAIVTGGTRGIGASISKKLKSSNFKVIANYASNDEAAKSFSKDNNIEVIKWDVSNFDECQKFVKLMFSDKNFSESGFGVFSVCIMHNLYYNNPTISRIFLRFSSAFFKAFSLPLLKTCSR